MPQRTRLDSSASRPPLLKPLAPKPLVHKPIVGWREWLALPELNVPRIKVKVDTGARTSALHAFDVERFERDDRAWVRFVVHPLQRNIQTTVEAEAPLLEERWVRSSNGKRSLRPTIRTLIQLGEYSWPIEVTLVRRDVMGFRMLLGRQAVRERRLLVDPGRSYLLSERPPKHQDLPKGQQ